MLDNAGYLGAWECSKAPGRKSKHPRVIIGRSPESLLARSGKDLVPPPSTCPPVLMSSSPTSPEIKSPLLDYTPYAGTCEGSKALGHASSRDGGRLTVLEPTLSQIAAQQSAKSQMGPSLDE